MFNLKFTIPNVLSLKSNTIPECKYDFVVNMDDFKRAARIMPAPECDAMLNAIQGGPVSYGPPVGAKGRLTIYRDMARFVWTAGEMLFSLQDWVETWKNFAHSYVQEESGGDVSVIS